MSSNIRWSGMTHRGRFRKNNEDAFLGLIWDGQEAHHLGKEGHAPVDGYEFFFAVSDGMGGAAAGEVASRMAVQIVTQKIRASIANGIANTSQGKATILENLFDEIHAEIGLISRHYEECRGMGATLSMVWISKNRVVLGHVGDSRIYHLPKDSSMRQVSEDHSEVGRLLRQGRINERESKTHPHKNILDQSLGANLKKIQTQTLEFEWERGEHLILCSDGIVDEIYDRTLERMIKEPPQNTAHKLRAERLIDEALFSSGRDNLTAMVVSME